MNARPHLLACLLAALALFAAACGNDDDASSAPDIESPTTQPSPGPDVESPTTEPTPTPLPATVIELELVNGRVADGVERHRVGVGETVTITATGDTDDELHIHGYNLVVEFSPGQPGTVTFEADIPGIFEVETHHRGDLVMEFRVG